MQNSSNNSNKEKKKVSVLIPCYNEEKSLTGLYYQLETIMNLNPNYVWEVLFVNDGSSDKSLDLIKSFRKQDDRICYLDLSRNFGKENAMLAGFDYVTGNCMVIIDADLQHPTNIIPKMLQYWEEGYEDVYAKRINFKESYFKRKWRLLFNNILKKTSGIIVPYNVGDFRLLDQKCIETMRKLRETERYTKGLFAWIGFKKKEITYIQEERIAGLTSWNTYKLLNLAIEGIISFTTLPLRFSTLLGIIVSFIAFLYMLFVFVKALIFGDPVQGYPNMMVVILFLGGVQLLSIGIIGEYLGRIFNETKNRPPYIAREYNEDIINNS